ncbi:phosphopantothenate-cysteine ligase [Moniliophthora roreri MCA 2997]|uniref:Phosphopantothenate-cysteine ligase n=2 Tax=Moniliophthora roreri TaxID=221103 RepID=V2XCN4_MONRO|nr:phosphopantothenate-cysteine ligase [Moniliophthora roreri MCA 2997]KAI3613214.1 phosphopantothenate-cysteine ligase [Moniliophthora roreri]
MSTSTSTTSFSAESYFATQPPPSTLEHDVNQVRNFVAHQAEQGRNVVLVTSGGTTVPLELNVVRFLDNFSAGTRGATSAEYFLQAGYAVIFMHRQFSLQPFSRHYSHSTNPFLDFLEIDGPTNNKDGTQTPPQIGVTPSKRVHLLEVLQAYKSVQAQGTLLTLTFVTVNDYLWLLRAVSQELSKLKRKAMYYLAAAVSDFFLPRQKLSEHKIQSGKGSLLIEMDQVPKILKPMVDEWSRDGYIVSFKLETDPALLIPKARAALERYGHQVVIGNDLHRRKFEVVFVSRCQLSTPPKIDDNWLKIDLAATEQGKEIEEDIVAELVTRHKRWIEEK